MKSTRFAVLAPLRHRDFRLLTLSLATSNAGSWAYNVGLAVYVYQETHSAAWVGAATVGRFVPSMLFGAYGGVLAERFERIKLMVAINVVCAALMVGLAVAADRHVAAWVVIVVAGVNGVANMTFTPADYAMTPQVVPEDQLAAANTLRNTVENLAVIAGPAIGGALLLAGPVSVTFLANAASFLAAAVLTAMVRTRSKPVDVTEGGEAGPLRQMLVGINTIRTSATATLLVTYSVIASFVYGIDTVQFVLVSRERLGTGTNGYGYLLAGLGVGAIAAAGLVNRISAWPRLGTVILAGMAVYCLPTLLFVDAVHSPAVAFVIQMVRGGGTLVVDVLAMTALQRSLPADRLARVMGAFFTLVLGAISLGAVLTPVLFDHTSLNATLWAAGLGLPVLCLLGWPWLVRMDNANVAHLAAIKPRVLVLQRAAILAEASQAVLERLATGATEVQVPAGAAVVTEGEEADAFYVIESGAMSVRSHGDAPLDTDLPGLVTGDYFGEIGLLQHIPRTATVAATTDSTLLRIDGAAFLDALTSASASTSLLEGARVRLARTPSYRAAPGTEPLAVVAD
ncbi:MAG TPA: MFS transporter [Jatrophihabitans sp.]|nr:MFS transporter [Jatrophihabitans sp.]